MKEIKIYLDQEQKTEAGETIEFEKVMAGETSSRKIWVHNNTDYYMNLELRLEGENISISENVDQIMAHKTKEVVFEFTPNITIMKPIKAKLKMKINYVIR